MNNRILTIAAVLAASFDCWSIRNNPNGAYAGGDYGDSSETKTEQKIKQKNVGSGDSTNVNCADNDINSASDIDAQVCGTAAFDPGRPMICVRAPC